MESEGGSESLAEKNKSRAADVIFCDDRDDVRLASLTLWQDSTLYINFV
jgi:hypothetical protein